VSYGPCISKAISLSNGFIKQKKKVGEKDYFPSVRTRMDTSTANGQQPASIVALRRLLQQPLRVTVLDGRIFLGTFVGTDQPLNILLANAEEYRIGPSENPNGRYVGQVMIPWRLVVKAEARAHAKRRNASPVQEDSEPVLNSSESGFSALRDTFANWLYGMTAI
jgi:small nuclear ribonucleoprotein (snRNP)-like protein